MQTINQVSGIAHTIAEAVSQQNTAIGDIDGSAQDAALSASKVGDAARSVRTALDQLSRSGDEMLSRSSELANQSSTAQRIDHFASSLPLGLIQPPVTLMCRPTAGRDGGAVDDEVVALGLARDRLLDGALEALVALGGAQRRAQVGGVLLAEAHVERAGAGDADAVAALAEIVGQRRDEADAGRRSRATRT